MGFSPTIQLSSRQGCWFLEAGPAGRVLALLPRLLPEGGMGRGFSETCVDMLLPPCFPLPKLLSEPAASLTHTIDPSLS